MKLYFLEFKTAESVPCSDSFLASSSESAREIAKARTKGKQIVSLYYFDDFGELIEI